MAWRHFDRGMVGHLDDLRGTYLGIAQPFRATSGPAPLLAQIRKVNAFYGVKTRVQPVAVPSPVSHPFPYRWKAVLELVLHLFE